MSEVPHPPARGPRGAPTLLWAPLAWLPGQGWRAQVLLEIDPRGRWQAVTPDVAAPPTQAQRLPGPVLPGLVNAHSHAFQRAFAGLAERRDSAHDDFWGWRERMYRVAGRISAAQLEAVAGQLYAELLQGGYTQVVEFHYLHHEPPGPGAHPGQPLAMAQALARAAAATGIGLTLLPVLYQRAGFNAPALRPDQQRFASTPEGVLAMQREMTAWGQPLLNAGVAVHSLRAATPDALASLVRGVDDQAMPLHIHIAEQTAEVADCLAATGQRPIAWLAQQLPLDARWQLVHATHAEPAEIDAVARAGAGVVICPSTEANLGDGVIDLPGWLGRGVPGAIGSDSHVQRQWPLELRLLEYSQRLALRQRNVAADPAQGHPASAARLLDHHLAGGATAAGFSRWGLTPGGRADLLVLDTHTPGLRGLPTSHLLDALVFATDALAFQQVWVAGQQQVDAGLHRAGGPIGDRFELAMHELWATPAS